MQKLEELYKQLLHYKQSHGESLPRPFAPEHLDCLLNPSRKKSAYMLVAPAFLGQFGENVVPGQLRTAFKKLGFEGMVEVALFADVLTLREALEYREHVKKEGDFQLTSCCCPVWISMIRDKYQNLMPHLPGTVSPMIACGRMIKRIHPDAITVFAGPCMAKKREAKEPDVAGAIDYVLTFQEVKEVLEAARIRPEEMEPDEREHASTAGRLYARTGGVSRAVTEMVEQLKIEGTYYPIKCEQANGTKECMEMIERIEKKETDANFFEGMGCIGGCVGGPKAILQKEEGKKNVDTYAEASPFATPLENPYVLKLLNGLGYETIEELLRDDNLLARDFSSGA